MKRFLIFLIFYGINFLYAQNVGINADGSTADNSAILDVKSTTKGVLISRMTQTERNAIVSPATGLFVYQIDATTGFYYYNGTAWKSLSSAVPNGTSTQSYLIWNGTSWVISSNPAGTGNGSNSQTLIYTSRGF